MPKLPGRAWLACLFAALLATPVAGAAPTASSIVTRHGHLRGSGNPVGDAHGEPLTSCGMALFWSQWGLAFGNGVLPVAGLLGLVAGWTRLRLLLHSSAAAGADLALVDANRLQATGVLGLRTTAGDHCPAAG